MHGILVPGGFGERGSEGKILAARFARRRKVPYFGICFGMQMAVIEAARDLVGLAGAGSTEFGPCPEPVVGLMTEWMRGNELETRKAERRSRRHHAARRLRGGAGQGQPRARDLRLDPHLRAPPPPLRGQHPLPRAAGGGGSALLGLSPDGLLPEIVEIPDHPWFIGVQFHPELKSRPFDPHPLFKSFIAAAVEQSRLV